MKRSILILLFISLFTICSFAQTEDKRLTDEQLVKRTVQLLADSSYTGLTYVRITSMTTEKLLAYSKKSKYSITKILSAKLKAEADYLTIRAILLDERTRLTWEEIDRKLGVR